MSSLTPLPETFRRKQDQQQPCSGCCQKLETQPEALRLYLAQFPPPRPFIDSGPSHGICAMCIAQTWATYRASQVVSTTA